MAAITFAGTEAADIAAYIASLTSSLTQTVSVGYHASSAAIPLDLTLNLPASVLIAGGTTSLNAVAAAGVAAGNSVAFTSTTYNSPAGTPNLNLSQATFTHGANNCVSDPFTVTATGPAGSSATRSITMTINDPGAPTANTYTATVIPYSTSPTTLTAPTLGGPSPSTLAIVGQGASGTAAVSGSNLTFASAATYVPQVTFTYRAVGPCVATYPATANSTTQSVTVNVTTPTPTTLNPTTAASFNSGAPVVSTTINIPALIGAVTGVVTGVSVTAQPATGTAVASGTNVIFTPLAGEFSTTRTFTYQTTGPGATFSGTVTVNVGAAGAPVISPASPAFAVPYNAGGAAASTIDLSTVITGALQSPNPITINTAPTRGAGIAAGAAASTTLSYTPNAGNLTADTFSFTAFAPGGASTSATVTINVTPPGPPTFTANPISVSVPFNAGGAAPTAINLAPFLLGTLNPNPVNITTAPALGSGISVGPLVGTTVSYTPVAGSLVGQSFQFTTSAPGGATSAVATVNIAITPPSAPTVSAKTAVTAINTAVPIDLTASVSGAFSSIAVAGAPANGTTLVAGNVITYTPNAGFAGTDTFTYTATGVGGTSTPATVTVTVTRATAGPVQMTVPLNTVTTLDLQPYIVGAGITGIAIGTAPRFGTATVNGTSVTYTPLTGYFGADTFTYIAFGTGGASAPGTVTVAITGRPDPSADASVVGTINNQIETARRFSQSQVSNFQRRMESLHRGGGAPGSGASPQQAGAERDTTTASAPRAPGTPAAGAALAAISADNTNARLRPSGQTLDPVTGLPMNNALPFTQVRVAGLSPPSDAGSPASGALAALGKISPQAAGLASPAASFATNRTLNLATIGGTVGGNTEPAIGATSFWMGGDARFGTRDPVSGQMSGTSFRTDGVSVGVDRRFTDKLVLGVGVGYAHDKASIGSDGTQSRATGTSVAAYGSYQLTEKTYIDGLLGYGVVGMDTDRFVSSLGAYAASHRTANQLFGSVTASYEMRKFDMLFSPYGRLDFTVNKLKQTSESGVGNFALTYFDQTDRTLRTTLGMRAESKHESDWGTVKPRARLEYQHGFSGGGSAQLAYSDLIGGPNYLVNSNSTDRNTIVAGVGGTLEMRNGLRLGLDYQIMRSFTQETSQAVRVTLEKELDGKGSSASLLPNFDSTGSPLGLRVDAGYMYDRNVSRGRDAAEKLGDQSYTLELSKGWIFPVSTHTRAVFALSGGAEKFHQYEGLSRIYGGALGEFQYRTSGSFSAPTYALFVRATGEQFESYLRDGYRYTFGASVRKPVTDRITLFGAVAHNERHGQSAVFTGRDNSARFNIDYAATANSTLYLTTEYRNGDAVSSGLPSLASLDIAKVFARDDAFNDQLFAYRFDSSTVIGTMGYNMPFGPRDTLDFSWRHVETTSSDSSVVYGKSRYRTDQLSLSYLLRF